MNFESAYLAALAALIVSLGGVVPTAPALNFRDSELAHLRAIVLAVGGTLPGVQLNYHDLVLANWRAAIVARGGTVPGVQLNFRLSHLLHVQAFQLALGNSVAFSGNYHEALLQLVQSAGVIDPDAAAYIAAVESADEQPLEASVKAAYNDFFVGTKADGDYSKLNNTRILGGARTLAGALVPLKSTMTAWTNVGFVSGDYNRNLGLKGGSNKYLSTNVNSNTEALNNNHLLTYITESRPTFANGIYAGVSDAAARHRHFGRASATQLSIRGSAPTIDNVTNSDTGLMGYSRASSANFVAYRGNSNSVVTRTSVDGAGAASLPIFALFGLTGPPALHTDARIIFASDGAAISTALQGRIDTLVAALAGI